MADLSGVRDGDEIAVVGRHRRPFIVRVSKISKRYIVDHFGNKWLIASGDESPRSYDRYDRRWAEPVTDAHRAIARDYEARAECLRAIDGLEQRVRFDTGFALRVMEALEPVLNDNDVDVDDGRD